MTSAPLNPCPARGCDGVLELMGSGIDEQLRHFEWFVCSDCAKTVERTVPVVHPSLFDEAGGA